VVVKDNIRSDSGAIVQYEVA